MINEGPLTTNEGAFALPTLRGSGRRHGVLMASRGRVGWRPGPA